LIIDTSTYPTDGFAPESPRKKKKKRVPDEVAGVFDSPRNSRADDSGILNL
jgi:hypothetical protein